MTSISQGLVLATAMAVSAGTILLFDLYWDKYFSAGDGGGEGSPPEKERLRSCLTSGGKKSEKKKKKRVQFAADVKEPSGNGEEYRKGKERRNPTGAIQTVSCGMPANRAALYTGMIRDRLQRTEFSY